MKIEFELVRIGKTRKDFMSERILEQNVRSLMANVRSYLEESFYDDKNKLISIVVIVPSKGHNIKMSLQDVIDKHIKSEFRKEFSNFIFKGKYSLILENINNRVFR
jgi:hypothetical protein